MQSVFAYAHDSLYKFRYQVTLEVDYLVGGIPSDPKVAEGWIKKSLGADNADLISEMVATTMIERGIEVGEAVEEVIAKAHLNGFKRDDKGLYLEGRCVKAAIKEASNILWPKRRWGPTNKGTRSFWAEHVFIVDDRIHMGLDQPTGIHQRFVQTWRGSSIQYEEYVEKALLSFELITDAGEDIIAADDWAQLWVCGEQQGVGSSRAVGYGRYVVASWERM